MSNSSLLYFCMEIFVYKFSKLHRRYPLRRSNENFQNYSISFKNMNPEGNYPMCGPRDALIAMALCLCSILIVTAIYCLPRCLPLLFTIVIIPLLFTLLFTIVVYPVVYYCCLPCCLPLLFTLLFTIVVYSPQCLC